MSLKPSIAQQSGRAKWRYQTRLILVVLGGLMNACAQTPAPGDCTGNRYLGSSDLLGHCSEDLDRDGIPDWLDRCPQSQSTQVDRYGCATAIATEPSKSCAVHGCGSGITTLRISDLQRGSSGKGSQISPALEQVLRHLREHPEQVALIEGHTDARGNATMNYRLGLERALSVRKALAEAGVAKYRLSVLSRGESQPLTSNASPQERRLNRRVEVHIGDSFAQLLPAEPACNRAVDGDCDGVNDPQDQCLSSPPGLAVSAQGCLLETPLTR